MKMVLPSLSVRFHARTREILLFVLVGFFNTAIDFAVLNLLILFTHHNSGLWLLAFTGMGFFAAVLNSYVINGRLTFRGQTSRSSHRFARFLAVNAVGLVINSCIVWSLVQIAGNRFSIMETINASKALAVLCSLAWNYIAMKRWVFNGPAAHPEDTLSVPGELVFPLRGEERRKKQLSRPPLRQRSALNRVILLPYNEREKQLL
jgi:putative flippase GtrA